MTITEIRQPAVFERTVRTRWTDICSIHRLTPNRGVAALVDDEAIAIFHLSSGELFAISNVDPYSDASVLSRGIVGDVDGVPTVASPLYKQRFDLRTGQSLEDADKAVATFPVRVVAGLVQIGPPWAAVRLADSTADASAAA